jgi:phytoene synthase
VSTSHFRVSRELARHHGRTYYLASQILPRDKRPYVWALYGFCRYADDIVDVAPLDPRARAEALSGFGERFFADLDRGCSTDPVLEATIETARRFALPRERFERFLRSMAMDLEIDSYETIDDLLGYMDGSAAVIGEMMLPILGPSSDRALGPARALGNAFQMTNFLRDVAEDLDRGRIYLPLADVRRFGAEQALRERRATQGFKDLMAFEIARTRRWYAESLEGDRYLSGASLRCIRVARWLYGEILREIERANYDVFKGRVVVSNARRAFALSRAVVPS